MDRATVIAGQIPLETDILKTGQFAMTGLAKLTESVLGTSTVVSGFSFAPAGGTLVAILGPGTVYQQQNLEQTAWSSLPADLTDTIVKQGIALASQNLTFTPPSTVGQSQVFLVEVAYLDQDTGSVVRPYYNAANPTTQFNGPGGAGTADNTTRKGAVSVQVKAGTAATSGTQVAPTPDAGYAGLWTVTLAQGATSISGGNIALYTPTSFLPVTLTGVPNSVQSGAWVYGTATGTNTYATTLFSSAAFAFTPVQGMEITVYFANTSTGTPTLNVNGGGAKSILKQNGGVPSAGDISGYMNLIYDTVNWRVNGLCSSDVLSNAATIIRTRLTANLNIFIATTGSDTLNTGLTVGSPFRTRQKAWNTVINNFDLNGFNVLIKFADGTYTDTFLASSAISGNSNGVGAVLFQGNVTTPANVIIAVTGGNCWNAQGGAQYSIDSMQLQTAGASTIGVVATSGGIISYSNITFSSCVLAHVLASSGGFTQQTGPCTITSGSGSHISAGGAGSNVTVAGNTITLTGTIAFTQFALVQGGSYITANAMSFGGTGLAGCTGTKYLVASPGGTIQLSGQVLPGNAAGTVPASLANCVN